MTTHPVFDQLNIIVPDVAAAAAFYELLGFTVEPTEPQWMNEHRTVTSPDGFDIDIDSAAFAKQWGNLDGGVVAGVKFATRAEVDERYAALVAAGGASVKPPFDAFWGKRYAVVRDPGGNAIGLMSAE